MTPVSSKILRHAEKQAEGTVLSAKALLHLGSRAAVDQALSRLSREGRLLRVGRGQYVSPIHSRFGRRPPRPEKVVEGISRATGETVAVGGARAANMLGLTTQVPVRETYVTSGRSRRVPVGRQAIELEHAPTWLLYAPERPAGHALRALAWLGPAHARPAAVKLKARLPRAEREALLAARARIPSWLARTISEVFSEEAHGAA